MKRRLRPSVWPLALAAAMLWGCASQPQIHSPVGTVRYSAIGHDPFWMVTIGDDRIVLTLGDEGGRADGAIDSFIFPRVLPVETGGVRSWQSADGASVISVEARLGPCTGSGNRIYADRVRVRLSDRELNGCGGPAVENEQD